MPQAFTGPASTPQAVMNSPACGVIAALNRRRSTTIQLVGDSTGDSVYGGARNAEWFERLGLNIAARHPGKNLLLRLWNDANQNYDLPLTLQTASGGERFTAFNAGAMKYSAPSITGAMTVTVRVKPTAWQVSGTYAAAAKYDPTGNNRGWQFGLAGVQGNLYFIASSDGIAASTYQSSTGVSFTGNTAAWIRMVYTPSTSVVFSTSTDGVTFTQLGSTVAVTQASLFDNSTIPYTAGGYLITGGSNNPFAGSIGWTQISNAAGNVVVPPMLEDWDQGSGVGSDSVLTVGGSTILLLDGSQSGQNITYFDDPTRRPKLMGPHGQDVIILSTNHNESSIATGAAWISTYSTWVTNIKAALPGVPIVCLSENPTYVAAAAYNTQGLTANGVMNRVARATSLMTWATSQSGVWGVDTYNAFSDDATQMATQLRSDGLHPNEVGAQAWADYVDAALFQAAA